MIVRNYKNSYGEVSYTVDVDGETLDVTHSRSDYGGVKTTPYHDFVENISEFDEYEAAMAEKFIRLQTEMMIYHVGFWMEVADDQ